MKFKRSIFAAFGFAALAASMPAAASASGSVTFSFGSGYDSRYYDAPYYGYDAYPDYARSGNYDDSYYDNSYYGDPYADGG